MAYFIKILFLGALVSSISKVSLACPGKQAALVYDASSNKILHSQNAHSPRYPASLTKKMTLYLAFQALKSGKIHFRTRFPVSLLAARQVPCKVNLRVGETVSVSDLIKATIVESANDAATALAEGLGGGSLKEFVRMMNATAKELGMSRSNFHNACGLHHPQQVTTAMDMLTLARALQRDFPEYYKLFSLKYFPFRGRVYRNHNRMLGVVPGMEGIKTGYIGASGFNISTSTLRNGHRIFTIVFGGQSWRARDKQAIGLINTFFGKKSGHPAISNKQDDPMLMYLSSIDQQSSNQSTNQPNIYTSGKKSHKGGGEPATNPMVKYLKGVDAQQNLHKSLVHVNHLGPVVKTKSRKKLISAASIKPIVFKKVQPIKKSPLKKITFRKVKAKKGRKA